MIALFDAANGHRRDRAFVFAVVWALTSVLLPLAVIGLLIIGGSTWVENVQNGQLYFLSLALLSSTAAAEFVIVGRPGFGSIYRALVFVAAVLSVAGYFAATRPVDVVVEQEQIASSVIILTDQSRAASVIMLIVASVFGTTTAFRQVYCADG